VEGDFDLELDDDDDDDCCWAVPVPIANGAELDGGRCRLPSLLILQILLSLLFLSSLPMLSCFVK
jgi:hypothetical protein